MDLTTVKVIVDSVVTLKTKLDNNEYGDAYAFASDMRLIWSNCLAYNPEGSEIRHYAQKLQSLFEDKFRQLVNQCKGVILGITRSARGCEVVAGGVVHRRMPSVEKRNEFAQNFNQLSAEQITHIVECLSQECPSAIEEVEGVVSGEE